MKFIRRSMNDDDDDLLREMFVSIDVKTKEDQQSMDKSLHQSVYVYMLHMNNLFAPDQYSAFLLFSLLTLISVM